MRGLYHFLLPVVRWDIVDGYEVLPVTRLTGEFGGLRVVVKRLCPGGVHCAAVQGRAMQEVFLASRDPQTLAARLCRLAVCS